LGASHDIEVMDLRARLLFLGKCHESMAGTGSICTAAASRVRGSVVNRVLAQGADLTRTLRIGHPLGVMTVTVDVDHTSRADAEPRFAALGFARTARRLMDGFVYVPHADLETT
jgi:2-methylaconitate cis-trans-isomerase PrpF